MIFNWIEWMRKENLIPFPLINQLNKIAKVLFFFQYCKIVNWNFIELMPQVAAYVTNEQLNASSEVREKTLTKVDLRKESIL